MSRRIAIVEDDAAIRENVADTLRRQGYEVATYPDRSHALPAFKSRLPDLAIVDIGLGADIDGGFTLVRELRAISDQVPIIFLTARDSDFDLVSGLRLGADDYLTLTEFWMVHALAKYPGHVKSRDSLMSDANLVVDDATVTSHIKRIRKKFLAADTAFDAIDTVYGMGYRWVAG